MSSAIQWAGAIAGGVTLAIGALFAVGKLVRVVAASLRKVSDMYDDWTGTPARPEAGIPEQPGLVARVAALERQNVRILRVLGEIRAEFRPNGGGSLHDQVAAIRRQTGTPPPPQSKPRGHRANPRKKGPSPRA